MIVHIKQHDSYAGKWIYEGYFRAWAFLGHTPKYYNALEEIDTTQEYYLMALDSQVNKKNLHVLELAKKAFLFVQPITFPHPWGQHPNFVSSIDKALIPVINNCKNIVKWSFLEQNPYHGDWGSWKTIPLAFDHLSYSAVPVSNSHAFDVCFIGGRANNGFDEKYRLMLEVFQEFQKTGLKCGFFIDKNLTHDQERSILYNSKIAINIHDAYQKKLGLDTNERTFKGLGLNGMLITDTIGQIGALFPDMKTANSPREYCKMAEECIIMTDKDLSAAKEANKKLILEQHTYTARIKELLHHGI